VHENSATDYEVELFFNALPPQEFSSIPDQRNDGYDPTNQTPKEYEYFGYTNGGFALMENLAANAILRDKTNQNAFIANSMMPMRTKDVVTDFFPLVLMPTLSFFVQIMYLPFLYRSIARIVGEKASRARESMRMMGMSEASYWSSWIIYWTAINTTIAVLCTLILIVNVFQAEHGMAVFLFFWIFGESLFGLLVIGQALFSNPKNAGATMAAIYFCTSLV
jgi:hypothetical protein